MPIALLKMNSRLMLLIKSWHNKILKIKIKNNIKIYNKSNKLYKNILNKKKRIKTK